jgi:apolipoprotein N-acyltransferase
MGVFRAIENRKPVIRAANTGISGFINSNGEILANSDLFSRTALKADIMTDRTLTFYTKYGDLFSFFCIVLSLLLIIKYRKKSPIY